jgi:formate dehydrogenase major subunit
VKGRYGFDYARHPQRLTVPLIRRADAPKDPDASFDPNDWQVVPRSQLGRGAGPRRRRRCAAIRDTHGRKALAGFGSAKGSNEEAYLFQKLVRWASAATTSTTARGCATRPAWRRCWKA